MYTAYHIIYGDFWIYNVVWILCRTPIAVTPQLRKNLNLLCSIRKVKDQWQAMIRYERNKNDHMTQLILCKHFILDA